jgi:hypothetical protein
LALFGTPWAGRLLQGPVLFLLLLMPLFLGTERQVEVFLNFANFQLNFQLNNSPNVPLLRFPLLSSLSGT